MKVKSESVDIALARLVSKSFALKFLRRAWPSARIQVVKNPPPAIVEGYHLNDMPADTEVWQVHCGNKAIEVVGPRDVLPFVAVREAFRCIKHMVVTVEPIKGGARLTAEPMPKPKVETPVAPAETVTGPQGIDS